MPLRLFEPPRTLHSRDWALIAAMGLGPLGAAFFLWDRALKLGDARQIGILSYLTPLASTLLLMLVSGAALSWSIAAAGAADHRRRGAGHASSRVT